MVGFTMSEQKLPITALLQPPDVTGHADLQAYLRAKATRVCSFTGNAGIDPGFSPPHSYRTPGERETAVASAVRTQPGVTPFPFADCDK